MDQERFEELVRSVNAAGTRREAVQRLVGGALASALAVFGLAEADAEGKGKKGKRDRKGDKGKDKNGRKRHVGKDRKKSEEKGRNDGKVSLRQTCTGPAVSPVKNPDNNPTSCPAGQAGLPSINPTANQSACVEQVVNGCRCVVCYQVTPNAKGEPGSLAFGGTDPAKPGIPACTVARVIVKGGNAAQDYIYQTPVTQDCNLVSPDNASGGPAAISHFIICGVGCRCIQCGEPEVGNSCGRIVNNCGKTLQCQCSGKCCTVDPNGSGTGTCVTPSSSSADCKCCANGACATPDSTSSTCKCCTAETDGTCVTPGTAGCRCCSAASNGTCVTPDTSSKCACCADGVCTSPGSGSATCKCCSAATDGSCLAAGCAGNDCCSAAENGFCQSGSADTHCGSGGICRDCTSLTPPGQICYDDPNDAAGFGCCNPVCGPTDCGDKTICGVAVKCPPCTCSPKKSCTIGYYAQKCGASSVLRNTAFPCGGDLKLRCGATLDIAIQKRGGDVICAQIAAATLNLRLGCFSLNKDQICTATNEQLTAANEEGDALCPSGRTCYLGR